VFLDRGLEPDHADNRARYLAAGVHALSGSGKRFGRYGFHGIFLTEGLWKLDMGRRSGAAASHINRRSSGCGRVGAGPSAVVLTMPGRWVIGSPFSNVWSFTDDKDVNLFTWQPFVNYNLDDGCYLTSSPVITANWEADSDDTWTVPLGAGIGKIFRVGNQPINVSVASYHNVEKPDFGADWQMRLQVQFPFPK
jgi:hypothetical protein